MRLSRSASVELPSEYTDTCSGVVRVWPDVAVKGFCGEGWVPGLRGRAGLLGLAWDEVRFSLVGWDELSFSWVGVVSCLALGFLCNGSGVRVLFVRACLRSGFFLGDELCLI